MNRNVIFLLAALVCSPWTTNAQTVPCECLDGSLDGVITNTDFLPFIMDWVWGDSISDGTEVGPGACDLDEDGTYNGKYTLGRQTGSVALGVARKYLFAKKPTLPAELFKKIEID